MHEEWRPVPGYEGVYSVSNLGNVRREAYILKRGHTPDGYPQHTFCSQKRRWCVQVHRLVAQVFLGEKPTPAHEVNHKDRVKENCRLDNLEYLTGLENVQHSWKVGTRNPARGENSGTAKLTGAQVLEIRRRLAAGERQVPLAREFGVHQATVWAIKHRKIWGHLAEPE